MALSLALAAGCGDSGPTGEAGDPGPIGPEGPPGDADAGRAAETCLGCHGPGSVAPVFDIDDPEDVHFVDTDADGPLSAAGYRQLGISIVSVDVTADAVDVVFDVSDEDGAAVDDIYAGDGRFALARLQPPAGPGDPTSWQALVRGERFTTGAGVFAAQGGGRYRYTSAWDPTSAPVLAGDTLRLGVQISARDLPAGNGVCDFDADLAAANDCVSPVTLTRDVVATAQCNGCHGVTSDVKLSFHGGGRTEVEYCVVCHDPGLGESDFKVMIHRIHYGAELQPETPPFRWAHVQFTRDIDDCTTCHAGGGADEANWMSTPNREACGSCHDTVNFDTGANHGQGGVQPTNAYCSGCHPATGARTQSQRPIATVHRGMARNVEAARYRGASDGFLLGPVTYDPTSDQLSVPFSVARDSGIRMSLESDPEWNAPAGASRLAITVGWSTSDYTNDGSDSTPSPAQPASFDALDVGGAVTALGGGDYELVVDLPNGASSTVAVSMEGHPAADLDGDGVYTDRIAVKNAQAQVAVEAREPLLPRRTSVEVAKCNACHDAAGAGISLHGNNRTGETQVCVVCHNANATDIARRPSTPGSTPDGKREETIDIKRMIHQIHRGEDLELGLVLYGFGGSVHDYSQVGFIGNLANCETCHAAGPMIYGAEQASMTLPSSVDTGNELTDPADDLNISPVTAVCSSCHDDDVARRHMLLRGGSFRALDEDIVR